MKIFIINEQKIGIWYDVYIIIIYIYTYIVYKNNRKGSIQWASVSPVCAGRRRRHKSPWNVSGGIMIKKRRAHTYNRARRTKWWRRYSSGGRRMAVWVCRWRRLRRQILYGVAVVVVAVSVVVVVVGGLSDEICAERSFRRDFGGAPPTTATGVNRLRLNTVYIFIYNTCVQYYLWDGGNEGNWLFDGSQKKKKWEGGGEEVWRWVRVRGKIK